MFDCMGQQTPVEAQHAEETAKVFSGGGGKVILQIRDALGQRPRSLKSNFVAKQADYGSAQCSFWDINGYTVVMAWQCWQ